jgi:hypothetical protein
MGSWFKHPGENIDAELECDAARARDKGAWFMLMSRLTDAMTSRAKTPGEDAIQGAPHIGFCRENNEALAYRFIGRPAKLQILLVGHAVYASDEGALKSEAIRRNAL